MEAKRTQVEQIQNYLMGCQAFFEAVITQLLLYQPADPHTFLLRFLRDMSPKERKKWSYKMGSLAGGMTDSAERLESSKQTPPIPGVGNLQVVLRLTSAKSKKYDALQVLNNLRANGKNMPGCLHFEIYEAEGPNILVLQTWTSQSALDDYHASSFFAAATDSFKGLLAEVTVFNV
jgi:quinol monooxygenase YgiN